MKRMNHRTTARKAAGACLALLCVAEMAAAHAWSLSVTAGPRRLFLHVGKDSRHSFLICTSPIHSGVEGAGKICLLFCLQDACHEHDLYRPPPTAS